MPVSPRTRQRPSVDRCIDLPGGSRHRCRDGRHRYRTHQPDRGRPRREALRRSRSALARQTSGGRARHCLQARTHSAARGPQFHRDHPQTHARDCRQPNDRPGASNIGRHAGHLTVDGRPDRTSSPKASTITQAAAAANASLGCQLSPETSSTGCPSANIRSSTGNNETQFRTMS